MNYRITKYGKKSLEELREILKKEGFEVSLFAMDAGDYYEDHKHDHDEIRIVASGSIEFGIGKEKVTLKQGDRLYLNRNTTHNARAIGKERVILVSSTKY